MSLYRVARNYRAAFRSRPIAFSKGATVDIDDETAAWVNHDSPGCLAPAGDDPSAVDPSDEEPAGDDLAALSKAELYERATEADIEGRSAMSKDELLAALRA